MERIKSVTRPVATGLGILLAAVATGYLLLVAVYTLPPSGMEASARSAAAVLQAEGKYPEGIPGWKQTVSDNFTDALMLDTAVFDARWGGKEGTVWAQTADNNRYQRAGDDDKFDDFIADLANPASAQTMEAVSYARYWNGYLVFLKPLMSVMDYRAIRWLNGCFEGILLIGVIGGLMHRKKAAFLPAFLLGVVCLTPTVVWKSLQYASVINVTLVVINLLLWQRQAREHLPLIFFIAGILTNYFDLLTFPLLSLGFPLVFVLILREEKTSFKDTFMESLKLALCWGLGFAGMWVGKWLLGSLVLGRSVLADAVTNAEIRAGTVAGEETITRATALIRNLGVYARPVYAWLFGGFTLGALGLIAWNRATKKDWQAAMSYLIVTALPFIWVLILANHSWKHYWMTHRILVIAVFAVAAGLTAVITSRREDRSS